MPTGWKKYFFGLMLFASLLYLVLRKGSNSAASLSKRPTNPNQLTRGLNEYSELAPFIFAQWQFESANFNSSLYQRAANASGMRIAYKRQQVKEGESNGYAVYKDWQQCLEDLYLYLKYVNFPKKVDSVSQFTFELKKRSYFSASLDQYQKGVQFYFNQI